MTDLVTFINETGILVTGLIPLQSLDDALILVQAYISDVGGWVPDDPLFPEGEGQPANGFSEQQTAEAIAEEAFDSVYDLNVTVNVTLTLQVPAKLSPGLSLNDAAISMTNQIIDYVTDQINDSTLPLRVESADPPDPDTDRSLLGGMTTTAIRQLIAADVVAVDKIIDYKASTVKYVRDTYGLDNTWNVSAVYTQPNEPITIEIQKYTDTGFATIDSGSALIYVFTVSPTTYGIISGVILNLV